MIVMALLIVMTLLLIGMLTNQLKTVKMTIVVIIQITNVLQMMTHRTKMFQKIVQTKQKKVKPKK